MAEKEYLEKEALINIMINGLFPDKKIETPFDVLRAIEQAPTVDVVEVVRCKTCKSWEECGIDPITDYHFGYCRHCQWQDKDDSRETNGQDFCSYGKRKE